MVKEIELINREKRDIISRTKVITVREEFPEYPSPFDYVFRKQKVKQWRSNQTAAAKIVREKARAILREDLDEKGLLGSHELKAGFSVDRGIWEHTQGEWKLDGRLFLFVGRLEGEGEIEGISRTVSSVRFAWSPHGKKLVISEIPVDKLVIDCDGENDVPEISFQFNEDAFVKPSQEGRAFTRKVLRFSHPNDYLQADRLARANLTIGNEDLDLLSLPSPEENGL